MTCIKFPHLLFAVAAVTRGLLAGELMPAVTVAADGSGDFTTIQAAIMAAPYHASGPPWIIRVKPGKYDERIYVLNRGRLYFENCRIKGHVDFIFGGATAWFENCAIHSRKSGYLAAVSTPPDLPYGFVFHRCKITGTEGEPYYRGRPWRPHAMTAFIDCEMDANVRPEGWKEWNAPDHATTVRYGEHRSSGPGAALEKRVAWAKPVPANLTAAKVLAGNDGWNPTR